MASKKINNTEGGENITLCIPSIKNAKDIKRTYEFQALILKSYDSYKESRKRLKKTRNDLKNNIYDKNKSWTIMTGVICDIKYYDDNPAYVRAILISFPFYKENDSFKKLSDDHIWLFVDNIVHYKDNFYKNRTVKLAIGSTLTFIAHVQKYKNEKYRNGIGIWSPLSSNIIVKFKEKSILASNKDLTALVCIYTQKENDVDIQLNEQFYLEKEIKHLRESTLFKIE